MALEACDNAGFGAKKGSRVARFHSRRHSSISFDPYKISKVGLTPMDLAMATAD